MAEPDTSILDNSPALIVAHDKNLGIGKNNDLPWHIKGDMKFFREMTTKVPLEMFQNEKKPNVVIMGRKTWESIPSTFKPLPNRINLVLTRDIDYPLPDNVQRSASIDQALQILDKQICGRIFIIGGASIYKEAMNLNTFRTLYVTEIEENYNCDVFFPEYRNIFNLIDSTSVISEGAYRYCHKIYKRTL